MGGRGASSGRSVGARVTSGEARLNTVPPTTADTRYLEVYYQRNNMTMKQRIKDIDKRIKEVNRSGTWQPDVIDQLAELKEYYKEIDGR